jgi:hypothetical protein
LPRQLQEDYIPEFLKQFADVLRSGDSIAEHPPEQSARIHGAERFHEGYSVRELLLELYWLRIVLFQEAFEFAQERADSLSVYADACSVIDRYVMEFQYRSMTVFVEKLQIAPGETRSLGDDETS